MSRKALIEKKKNELKKLESKIYEIDDLVAAKVKELREKKEFSKSIRVKDIRIDTHNKTIQNDSMHRPSDREFGIRGYSKMDLDIWKYEGVRDWFNSGASDKNPLEFNLKPIDTGYTIRVDESYRDISIKEKYEKRFIINKEN